MSDIEKEAEDNGPLEETDENLEKNISIGDLMKEDLHRASKDAEEYKDKYFRSIAEMENLRKRMAKEQAGRISFAIDNMLQDFIAPLDNLENALRFTDNLSEEIKLWAQGFKLITEQFKQVLEDHGITPFSSLWRPFDPHFHEAIEMIETHEHEENIVIEEIIKGYRHGERVIRVAKVKVAKAPVEKIEQEKD